MYTVFQEVYAMLHINFEINWCESGLYSLAKISKNLNLLFLENLLAFSKLASVKFDPWVRNLKIIFLYQPKHMLWVLKRNISMRWFFWAPKAYV